MKKQKLHYAWIIAGALFCLQGGIYGILMNCRGMFHAPVCETFGFVLGDFTLYTFFYGVSAVLTIPIATRLISKVSLPLMATVCSAVIAIGQFCQGYFTELWQWYAMAVVQGACQVVVYTLTVGIIVNNWFHERRGVVMSLIGTASGLIGAVLNIVCNNIIVNSGWQSAYRFLGVLLFVLMVPSSMLLRLQPSDKGLLPYGYKAVSGETELPPKTGVPIAEANRSPSLFMFLLGIGTICALTCYNQYVKDYAITLGFSTETASLLVSLALVGNIITKLVLGYLSDKIGFRKAQIVGVSMIILSAVLLPINNIVTLYVSSFFMGASMASASCMNPMWTRTIFGDLDYVKIYAKGTLVNSIMGSVGFTICGYIISAFGYPAFMYFGIFLALLTLAATQLSHIFGKRLKWVSE